MFAFRFIYFLQAEKIIGEMERNCESKLLECRDESKQKLKRLQEENANLVCLGKDAQLPFTSLGS